ncbi:MAG: hypothetical protein A4E49_00008 [Methanosaeta sp. PtaU1.Bin112]|nr:MAG: hypothetical protein A4E49_00008 [Methanosaeta sp. PtaU1.Bin112]
MLTYQVRPRVFWHDKAKPLVFPNNAEVRFHKNRYNHLVWRLVVDILL